MNKLTQLITRMWSIYALSFLVYSFSGCSENDPGESATIGFQLPSSIVSEGSDMTVLFSISLPSGVTPIFTLGGTATEGADYTYTETPLGIVFTTIDDGIEDSDETIVVTLSGFQGNASPGGTVVHTLTIVEAIDFISTSNTRDEGAPIIVAFSRILSTGVVPTFTVSGTASQGDDYTYTLNQNGLIISTKTDEIYDPGETVIIEITGFSGGIPVGANNKFTLTIVDPDESEDARIEIKLTWEVDDGSPGNVDMDLLVWYETSPGTYTSKGNLWSTEGGSPVGTPFESTAIYDGVEPDGKWGFSYVYFSGTSDDLEVTVNFRSYQGNINGTSNRATFTTTYTLVNINNNYDQFFNSGDVLAQTFMKSGGNVTDLGEIYVAPSGSRHKSVNFVLDDAARTIIEKKMSRSAQE